jgi:hypothetical protein
MRLVTSPVLASSLLASFALVGCAGGSTAATGAGGAGAQATGGSSAGGQGGQAGGAGGQGGQAGGAGGQGGQAGGAGGQGGTPEPTCDTVVPAPTVATASLELTANGLNGPVAGVTIEVCAKSDPSCASPLDAGVTDLTGAVVLTVATGASGFDGYFRITSPDILTSELWTSVPIVKDESLGVVVVAPAILSILAGAYGVTLDESMGQVAAILYQCSPTGAWVDEATGATLAMTPAAELVGYTMGQQPAPGQAGTDVTGAAAGINVPPGDVVVENRDPNGDVVGVVTVPAKAGVLTQIAFGSTP